jgi:hypothetical protein
MFARGVNIADIKAPNAAAVCGIEEIFSLEKKIKAGCPLSKPALNRRTAMKQLTDSQSTQA